MRERKDQLNLDWENLKCKAEDMGVSVVDLLVSWWGEYYRSDAINLWNAYLASGGTLTCGGGTVPPPEPMGTLSVRVRIGTRLIAGVGIYVDGAYQGVSTSITGQVAGQHVITAADYIEDGVTYRAASTTATVYSEQVTQVLLDLQRVSGGEPVKHRLTVTASAGGDVVADPYAPDGLYLEGTTVMLEALALDGYRFDRWVLDGEEEFGESIPVYMDRPHAVSVTFVPEGLPPPPPPPKGASKAPLVFAGLAAGVVGLALSQKDK